VPGSSPSHFEQRPMKVDDVVVVVELFVFEKPNTDVGGVRLNQSSDGKGFPTGIIETFLTVLAGPFDGSGCFIANCTPVQIGSDIGAVVINLGSTFSSDSVVDMSAASSKDNFHFVKRLFNQP
jgi:hypothetical protein